VHSQNFEQRLLASCCLSVYSQEITHLPLDGLSWDLIYIWYTWKFFENVSRKGELRWNLTRITGTSHQQQYTFFIISRWFLLRMKNVSDQSFRENQNTHFPLNRFFRKSYRLWDKIEKYCRAGQATDGNIIRRMRISCCAPKAIDTHSEYVIFTAFSSQQWLHERASILRYTYIAHLVILCFYQRTYDCCANWHNYEIWSLVRSTFRRFVRILVLRSWGPRRISWTALLRRYV